MTKTKQKYSEKQARYVEYIRSKFPDITPDVHKDARAFAGYSENYPIATILKGLGDLLQEDINDMLVQHGLEAAGKQIQVMRNPSSNWRAELAASSNILDKIGIGKKEEQAVIAPVGLLMMPTKKLNEQEELEE